MGQWPMDAARDCGDDVQPSGRLPAGYTAPPSPGPRSQLLWLLNGYALDPVPSIYKHFAKSTTNCLTFFA
jgi:hypothetical protein